MDESCGALRVIEEAGTCYCSVRAVHRVGYRVGVFFFKQKTAYEMRISDRSSDVCSSDLFSSISAGINALYGPLHGGANEAVLDMLALTALVFPGDRKSVVEGKSVYVRVDLGGRWNIQQTTTVNRYDTLSVKGYLLVTSCIDPHTRPHTILHILQLP